MISFLKDLAIAVGFASLVVGVLALGGVLLFKWFDFVESYVDPSSALMPIIGIGVPVFLSTVIYTFAALRCG